MSLNNLPNELLIATTEYLFLKECRALGQTNRHFHALTVPRFERELVHHKEEILTWAVKSGDLPLVKLLIEKGADFRNNVGDDGQPLEVAVRNGHVELVKFLLSYQNDMRDTLTPREKNSNATALNIAVANGNRTITLLLLDHGPDYIMPGWAALRRAISFGFDDLSELLIERGSMAVGTIPGLLTPLHLAAARGRIKVIQMLLDRGANINAEYTRRRTPLHMAIVTKKISPQLIQDTTRFLVEKGADITIRDAQGNTPFLLAAKSADPIILKMLLDHGADITDADNRHRTALHHVVVFSPPDYQRESLEVLLGAGMNINIIDRTGHTPLSMAVCYEHPGLAEDLILRHGAEVNCKNLWGCTPLHEAVAVACPRMSKLILSAGGEIDARNLDGETPLHRLRVRGLGCQEEVAKLLVENGCNINAQDNQGRTILFRAAELCPRPRANVLYDLLLELGADASICDALGRTPAQKKIEAEDHYVNMNHAGADFGAENSSNSDA